MKIIKQLILFMLIPFAAQAAEIADQNKLLFDGAEEGNIEKVIAAIENGADVNAKCNKYRSLNEFPHTLVSGLIDYEQIGNYSALHIASFCNHSTIVKLLLEKKADVNAQEDFKSKPLHWALRQLSISESSIEIRKANYNINIIPALFKENGYDGLLKNIEAGQDAYSLYLKSEIDKINDIIKLLVSHGANISKEHFRFHWMLSHELNSIKKIFNLFDCNGKLTMAVISNDSNTVATLLKDKSIDQMIDFVDASGHTPLMHAVVRDDKEILKQILKLNNTIGINFNAQNENGDDALALAQKFNKPNAINLLNQHGNQLAEQIHNTSSLPFPISKIIVQLLHGENIFSHVPIDDVNVNNKVNAGSGCLIQ